MAGTWGTELEASDPRLKMKAGNQRVGVHVGWLSPGQRVSIRFDCSLGHKVKAILPDPLPVDGRIKFKHPCDGRDCVPRTAGRRDSESIVKEKRPAATQSDPKRAKKQTTRETVEGAGAAGAVPIRDGPSDGAAGSGAPAAPGDASTDAAERPSGMQAVRLILSELRLDQYADTFEGAGFDSLEVLIGMRKDKAMRQELGEAVGMRTGHVQKFFWYIVEKAEEHGLIDPSWHVDDARATLRDAAGDDYAADG